MPAPDAELWAKTRPTWTYMEREKFPGEFSIERPYGKIYDKLPFKVEMEAGVEYKWCSCGHSKSQVNQTTIQYLPINSFSLVFLLELYGHCH